MKTENIDLEGGRDLKGEDVKRILGLKNSAFEDYLSARVLYNNDLLLQATFLANTCIEKELKACIEIASGRRLSSNHETYNIYHQWKRLMGFSETIFNETYLKQLQKIYRCRYYEKLSPGYNFVIIKKKYLAELDYTFSILTSLITSKMDNASNENDNLYETHKQLNDLRLFNNNHILNEIPLSEFVETRDLVYEFRILENHSNANVIYLSSEGKIKNDGCFEFEALAPLADGLFKMSHL